MKFRIWVVGLALLMPFAFEDMVVAQSSSQTATSAPGFSLTIYAAKPEVTLGSNLWIGIRVTNVSKNPIQLLFGRYGNVSIGFKYDVRGEKGAELKKVQHSGGLRPSQPPGSERPGVIQPGQSEEVATMVSDIYQFDHPGKYTIQVSRKERGMPIVLSNTITVTAVKGTDSSGGSAHSSHLAGL